MLTHPPLRHCFMLLSFGAAGLLLAAEWRTLRSPSAFISLQPSKVVHLETILEKSPIAGIVKQTRLVIHLKQRKLDFFEGDKKIMSYPIAVGQDDWETPVGHFVVMDMRRDPVWLHPITKEAVPTGADNPLGTRWVGFAFAEGYRIGIHGTYEENLVGQAVSHGCVRMRDRDIQALFEHLSIGTPITVRPD